MSRWAERLEIADIFQAKLNEEITLAALARGIVERAEALTIRPPDHLIDPFRELAEDEAGDDVEEFDTAWNDFYNWADRARVWVNTFAPARKNA